MREDKLSIQSMDFAVEIINLVKELKVEKESIISCTTCFRHRTLRMHGRQNGKERFGG